MGLSNLITKKKKLRDVNDAANNVLMLINVTWVILMTMKLLIYTELKPPITTTNDEVSCYIWLDGGIIQFTVMQLCDRSVC